MKSPRLTDMKWTDAKGRTWEVLHMERPGEYAVATTDRSRIGTMNAHNIRRAFQRAAMESQ